MSNKVRGGLLAKSHLIWVRLPALKSLEAMVVHPAWHIKRKTEND